MEWRVGETRGYLGGLVKVTRFLEDYLAYIGDSEDYKTGRGEYAHTGVVGSSPDETIDKLCRVHPEALGRAFLAKASKENTLLQIALDGKSAKTLRLLAEEDDKTPNEVMKELIKASDEDRHVQFQPGRGHVRVRCLRAKCPEKEPYKP